MSHYIFPSTPLSVLLPSSLFTVILSLPIAVQYHSQFIHSSSNKQTTRNTTLNTVNPTSQHCCQLNYTRTAITTHYLHTPEHDLVHRRQSDHSYGLFHNVTAMGYWTGYCHKKVTVLCRLPVPGVR